MIVVRRRRSVRLAERIESKAQHFFARRLAGAPGDGNHAALCPRARRTSEILEAALRVGDEKQRCVFAYIVRSLGDESGRGATFERSPYETMPVTRFSVEGTKEIA